MKTQRKTQLSAIFLVIFVTFFTSIGQVFLKNGLGHVNNLSSILNFSLFFGLLLYEIGFIITLFALRKGELSILSPLMALSYIWVILLAFFIFSESITLIKILGISFILLGVSLIGLGRK